MITLLASFALLQSTAPSVVPDLRAFLTDTREDSSKVQAIWAFGQCAAERDRARTIAFLKGGQFGQPNDPTVRELVAATGRCVASGTSLTFNQVYFAGATAEAIYRLNGFRFAEHPISMSVVNSLASLGSKSVVGGACVAAHQPQQVDALFKTAVGSAAEARVVMSMYQSVQTCLPQVKRTPEMIRAVIAAGAFPAVTSLIDRQKPESAE